jgi:WhiB family redox-sensing transcriptional regulator
MTARALPSVIRHPDIACAAEDCDPEVFFPNSGGSPDAALKYCGRCLHAEECLRFALDTDQRIGIWGGLTATERHHRQLDRIRRAA